MDAMNTYDDVKLSFKIKASSANSDNRFIYPTIVVWYDMKLQNFGLETQFAPVWWLWVFSYFQLCQLTTKNNCLQKY